MKTIIPVDPARFSFNIHRDLSVVPAERQPGPPERIDGVTVGIVTMRGDAPHGGEVHPDGDEILYVISGRTPYEEVVTFYRTSPGAEPQPRFEGDSP